MTTPTPEAIESIVTQVETMHGILAYNGSQVVCACDRTWKPAEDYAAHITRAAAPFIAAKAKAEALREAAEYAVANIAIWDGNATLTDVSTEATYDDTATWLRTRAATIESEATNV